MSARETEQPVGKYGRCDCGAPADNTRDGAPKCDRCFFGWGAAAADSKKSSDEDKNRVRVQRACSPSAVVGDGERLDYLERNPKLLAHCSWWNSFRGQIFSMGCEFDATIGDCHKTLRAAIDRALAVEREAGAQKENA